MKISAYRKSMKHDIRCIKNTWRKKYHMHGLRDIYTSYTIHFIGIIRVYILKITQIFIFIYIFIYKVQNSKFILNSVSLVFGFCQGLYEPCYSYKILVLF